MKKSELKKILKPLITECIKEVMFEDGVLSGIISEVARGMGGVATEAAPPKPNPVLERMNQNAFGNKTPNKLTEHKKQLMSAIGQQAYNGIDLFEGTTPAPGQSDIQDQASPLANIAPGDAGVSIDSLFGSVGTNWNAHMSDVKERK
tara:strand:- start:13 stop:453 length:441 start_codon:yes stop_codon:yes gene_type:complete